MEEYKVFVYTDGACKNNGKPDANSGIGGHIIIGKKADNKSKQILSKYYLASDGYRLKKLITEDTNFYDIEQVIEYYGDKDFNTNNRAEIGSVIEALNILDNLDSDMIKDKEILILTDSKYVQGYLNKIIKEKKIDTNINVDLIEALKDIIDSKFKNRIKFKDVTAHMDDLGNNRADMLANMGVAKTNDVVVKIFNKDFWKLKQPSYKHIFYNKFIYKYRDGGLKTIYGLNYKKERDIGMKSTEVNYSISVIDDEIVKSDDMTAIKLIDDIVNGSSYNIHPRIIRTDDLLKKEIFTDVVRYGLDFLYLDNNKIYTHTGVEVGRILTIPYLAYNAEEKFKEALFFANEDKRVKEVDITDMLYDNHKLKNEFINNDFKLKVRLEGFNIVLNPKLDIPNRNILKRYEKSIEKVVVKYKLSEGGVIRYLTVFIGKNYRITTFSPWIIGFKLIEKEDNE